MTPGETSKRLEALAEAVAEVVAQTEGEEVLYELTVTAADRQDMSAILDGVYTVLVRIIRAMRSRERRQARERAMAHQGPGLWKQKQRRRGTPLPQGGTAGPEGSTPAGELAAPPAEDQER